MSITSTSSSFSDFIHQADLYLKKTHRKAASLEKKFNKQLLYVAKEIRNNSDRPDFLMNIDLRVTKLYLKSSTIDYDLEVDTLLDRISNLISKIDAKTDISNEESVTPHENELNNLLSKTAKLRNNIQKSLLAHNNIISILENRIDAMLSRDIAD